MATYTSELLSLPREAVPDLLNKLYHLYYETDTEWFNIREDTYSNGDWELRINTDLIYLKLKE